MGNLGNLWKNKSLCIWFGDLARNWEPLLERAQLQNAILNKSVSIIQQKDAREYRRVLDTYKNVDESV